MSHYSSLIFDINVEGDKDELVEVDVQQQYTPSGKPFNKIAGYISHRGLKEERRLIESDITTLQNRLTEQARKWVEEWNVINQNKRAESLISEIRNILKNGVKKEITINWEKAKDKTQFPKIKPTLKGLEPKLKETNPKPNLLDKLFKKRYERLLLEQKQNYEKALNLWRDKKTLFEIETREWEKEKLEFKKRQEEYNKRVENTKNKYQNLKPQAIELSSQILLEQSKYPIIFNKKIAVEYKASDKLLIVEYFLPSIDNLPKIKETKYLKTKNEFKDIPFSDREFNSIYEETLYQITLRTVYELFKSDIVDAINNIVFNGWVNNINRAIGKRQDICILSLMVSNSEYMDINLTDVDPKACFKRFKGVSASELSVLTPIPPILRISREDRRFIEEREVGNKIDDSANLAAMDWQDFEHLIREIFEREFSSIGGEVKVTQSSRDKGVDAVAFDPDPIRGGKVIIQAKRYTNTVHIESVRALYGIMQDEGAMKGILITTSDFGSDAYNFSKNKPISLLNGGNLLSMLHRHGFKGQINLEEAKKILNE